MFVAPPFTDENFAKIHEARAEFFSKEHYPASTLVIVHQLSRPEAMLEIDCDAVVIKTPARSRANGFSPLWARAAAALSHD